MFMEKMTENKNHINAETDSAEKIRNVGNIMTAAVFLTVISALLIISVIFPDRQFSENENRYLAQLPEIKVDAVADGSFGADFELYAQDQLVGRDALMMLKTAGDKIIGRKDNGNVYFGRDDYIFAIEQIDFAQLEKNIGYVEKFCGELEKEGINVRVIAVPTATEILADKLPKNASVPNQSEAVEKIKEEIGGRFIDVTGNLKAHSKEYIYYRTDHHWTSLGAYYAYRQYEAENFATGVLVDDKNTADFDSSFDYFRIEAPASSGYEEKVVSENFLGTNYSKAPSINARPDTIMRIDKAADDYKSTEARVGEKEYPGSLIKMSIFSAQLECEKTLNSVYDESYLDKKDKYSYFLSGNNPITVIETNNKSLREETAFFDGTAEADGTARNLLVIKDSYAHSFISFLTDDFDRITAVDMRYYRSRLDRLIEEYEITDVLVLYNILNFANDSNLIYLAR